MKLFSIDFSITFSFQFRFSFLFSLPRVFFWQPNAGSTVNSQILNEVSQCAESINGVKEGRWKATLTFYKPILRGQLLLSPLLFLALFSLSLFTNSINRLMKLRYSSDQALSAEFPREFIGISLPEQPNKYYFVLRFNKIVLESDSSIQLIMEKLQSYKSRVALNFEVIWFHFSLSNPFHLLIVGLEFLISFLFSRRGFNTN